MIILPGPVRSAIVVDLLLNAANAVSGPAHPFALVASPIGQFGVLVATGIALHEMHAMAVNAWGRVRRWHERRRRQRLADTRKVKVRGRPKRSRP